MVPARKNEEKDWRKFINRERCNVAKWTYPLLIGIFCRLFVDMEDEKEYAIVQLSNKNELRMSNRFLITPNWLCVRVNVGQKTEEME